MQNFLLRLGLLGLCALVVATSASGALVKVNGIVVHADGGFTPQTLPRHDYAPISFKGFVDINPGGARPVPPLREVRLDFDRDGRLSTKGLPICSPEQIEGTTTTVARRRCADALVGTGHAEAVVPIEGGAAVVITTPLSVFNGPRQDGHPTAVGHGRVTFPSPQTYVEQIPIERRRGAYAYRATIEVPEFAEGRAVLSHVDAEIGRRYRAGGRDRSYTSARCSDGVLETRGRLEFADGTVIEGDVFRACFVPQR